MAFDTLTKTIRLLTGRRYTSTDLTDSQEAFASTIQMGSSEIWTDINLIPSASLPFSSSATPSTTITSGVVKYWYKWPLTVANNTITASSVWYFTSPTGSVAGIGSQLIDNGQQVNFISPKYIRDLNIVNQSADADNNGNPPGYNIALFTSANGVTFTPLSPSASYQFDYKSGILQFTTTTVPNNRVYATVYQYIGKMLSDENFTNITSSNISASVGYFDSIVSNNITASNISVSGYISSSTINTTNLYAENGLFTNITCSNISASNSGEFNTLTVRGDSFFYGNLTAFGSSSIINISSSTVIIGDNRIQLNAFSTGSFSQRYAGLDLSDSGSTNNVTSSLLWDSLNNYWLLTNNQTGSNPVLTSSALILQGPISEFGNEKQLPVNTFLKVESAIGNLTSSNLSEIGNNLLYNGEISSSTISASSAFFGLDVLISGVLKIFGKVYAYSGLIGDVTGSLTGSKIIVTSVTSSNITASTIVSENNKLTNITSSNISASGYVSSSFVSVSNTINASTGSFIYLNVNNTGSAPTSPISYGNVGEIRFDNHFIYIYTNNRWVRSPISQWDANSSVSIFLSIPVSSGSVVFTPVATLSAPINQNYTISFSKLFNVTSGSQLSLSSSITIPANELSASSTVTISGDDVERITSGSSAITISYPNIVGYSVDFPNTDTVIYNFTPKPLLYYTSSVNTFNWYTGDNFTGTEYNNVILSNFASNNPSSSLSINPAFVKSLYFNTSSIEDSIYSISNLDTYKVLNALDIKNQSLTEINVSKNNYLQYLYCSYNNLVTCSLSSSNDLRIFDCSNNQLINLNISSSSVNLVKLICNDNNLGGLILGNKPSLNDITCSNNILLGVGGLNVSSCSVLQKLNCQNSGLFGLDITNNNSLTSLNCSYNLIPTINLISSSNLNYLDCSRNQITSLNLSNLNKCNYIDTSYNTSLNSITLSGTNISTSSVFTYNFSNCNLHTTEINYILSILDSYNINSGSLNISGASNEGPSGNGITYKNNLISKGWTIVSNTIYPTITDFNPKSGSVGTVVHITGSYLTSSTSVTFGGFEAGYFNILSDANVDATFPEGPRSGSIIITTTSGSVSSSAQFTGTDLFPWINTFSPLTGSVGTSVVLTGYYFGDVYQVEFFDNYVTGITASYTIDSETQITTIVPSGSTTGPIMLTNNGGSATPINGYDFFVIPVPNITSFNPQSGSYGALIQITGSGFNYVTSVRFNNITSSYTLIDDNHITATVLTGSSTGYITAISLGGTGSSSPSQFNVINPPIINSFTPISGGKATRVTITGFDFNNTTLVTFNNITASYYTVDSNTQITADVPNTFTKSGPIGVVTLNGSSTSSTDFTYVTPPVAKLEYTPTSSLMNWYTALNYGGTANTNVTLSYFQTNVTPTDVYTIEFLDDANITSISNLSTYTNLKTLDVTFQNLSSLNLTANTSIGQLYCDNNDLTSLDLSNNNYITILSCDNNTLSSLNVNNMSSLSTLSCISCTLSSLTLTSNTNLKYLKVNNNQLSSINLNNNTQLITADLSENLLTSINISNNTALTSFNIGNNTLSSINVSANTLLTDLNIESNAISTFTGLSSLTNLQKLQMSNNQVTSLDLSNNNNLVEIYASVNNLTSVTMKSSVNITTTYHLDLSFNSLTTSVVNSILQTVDTYTTPSGNNMTDKFIDLSGGSNGAPTGAGLTAKTSLIAKGYQVLTN